MFAKQTIRKGWIKAALFASVAPGILFTAAHGQTATQQTVKTEGKLEEVTVTVARRKENLQKVSAAVQVVTGAKIASQGLTNIAQIVADVPSVQATSQPAGFSIDIRGQGGDLPSGQSQGSVALEIDGVYNITSIGTTIGFFDLDRLEVLPGPQSTQYGPDADGGVVDVQTKDPVIGGKSGYVSLTVGNYNLVRVEAAQDIALGPVLAARIAGAAIYRGSYYTPATTNAADQSARIKLLYRPSDNFSTKLAYEIDHVGGTGNGYEVGGPPTLGNLVAEYPNCSINNKSNPWNINGISSNGVTFANSQSHLYQNEVTSTTNYQLNDWFAADEILGFTDIVGSGYKCGVAPANFGSFGGPEFCENNPPAPYNFGPYLGNGTGTVYPYSPLHSYSSETRIHNVDGSRIVWNLGFYHWSYTFAGHTAEEPIKGEGWTRTTTNAIFGQVTYPVTDAFRVIGGARESFDTRDRNQDNFNNEPTLALAQANRGTIVQDAHLNLSHFDYTGGVEYDASSNSHEYAKVSTGYRPGSINLNGAGAYVVQPNEVNTAIEVGTKNRFFNNSLQLNGDFFYYIQKGYQFGDGVGGYQVTQGSTTYNCFNGPGGDGNAAACQLAPLSLNAHDVGLEGQIRYIPDAADQFSDNFTLMNATFDKKQSACRGAAQGLPAAQAASGDCYAGFNDPDEVYGEGAGALAGQQVPQFFDISGGQQAHSPHFSTTVNYDHMFDLGAGTLKVGGEVYFSSGYYVHPVEYAASYQPSYFQEGLTFDFTPVSGKWEISGYAHNLSNYAVKESALPSTTIGDPRTYGVNFNYHW